MKLRSLVVATIGVLSSLAAHAGTISYSDTFNLRAFPDTAPSFPGVGGYEFQDEVYRTTSATDSLSVPKFNSSLGVLLGVSLQLTSTISPALDYDYVDGDWVPNGYFPGTSYDRWDEVYFTDFGVPYLSNDASLAYNIFAALKLSPLVSGVSPVGMSLAASSSCSHSELTLIVTGVSCETNDANGFGTFVFNWTFTIADVTPFIGPGNLGLEARLEADLAGYCDYDDDSDYASQDYCKVDPSFSWFGNARIGYTYTALLPDGGGEGGDGGGGGGGAFPVPEPPIMAMLATGLIALFAIRRRKTES